MNDRVVAAGGELVSELEDAAAVQVGAVLLVVAAVGQRLELCGLAVKPGDELAEGTAGHRGYRCERQDVAVGVDQLGDPPQVLDLHPAVKRGGDLLAVLGEQPCQPRLVAAVEREPGGERV